MSTAAGEGPAVPRQPSLFGADARYPTPEDLTGLLAGTGELARMGGTARVSVVVGAAWRVHVLMAELASRGVPASWEPTGQDGPRFTVRTAYTAGLAGLARAWCDGAPGVLHLDGAALRLWVAAAGAPVKDGWLLPLGRDQRSWPVVGAALSAAGVAAALVVPARTSPDAPGYRIAGRRRLARLAELVGDRPMAAPMDGWPRPPGPPTRR